MILIQVKNTFAWLPIKTENSGWVWLKKVLKYVDDNPIYYLGLTSEVKYILPNMSDDYLSALVK